MYHSRAEVISRIAHIEQELATLRKMLVLDDQPQPFSYLSITQIAQAKNVHREHNRTFPHKRGYFSKRDQMNCHCSKCDEYRTYKKRQWFLSNQHKLYRIYRYYSKFRPETFKTKLEDPSKLTELEQIYLGIAPLTPKNQLIRWGFKELQTLPSWQKMF